MHRLVPGVPVPGRGAAVWIGLLVGLAGCAGRAGPVAEAPVAAGPQAQFWNALRALCGQAFAGKIVENVGGGEGPDPFEGKALRMHVRSCSEDEIRLPFHVGEDRSRTWVFTRRAWRAAPRARPSTRRRFGRRIDDVRRRHRRSGDGRRAASPDQRLLVGAVRPEGARTVGAERLGDRAGRAGSTDTCSPDRGAIDGRTHRVTIQSPRRIRIQRLSGPFKPMKYLFSPTRPTPRSHEPTVLLRHGTQIRVPAGRACARGTPPGI